MARLDLNLVALLPNNCCYKINVEVKMRNLLIFLACVSSMSAFGIDMKEMDPVSCEYSSHAGTEVNTKLECGNFKICQANVLCSYVDSKVFKNDYQSDRAKAALDAKGWLATNTAALAFPRSLVAGAKIAWSELSGSNPKFLTGDTRAYCATKSGSCPSALNCILDKQVDDVKDFNTSKASGEAQEQQSAGSIK